uniref:Uncharacterized protein n=1 Tax=Trichuris muris TaxID=70415 RepID=A0A5S6R534_TRIMR
MIRTEHVSMGQQERRGGQKLGSVTESAPPTIIGDTTTSRLPNRAEEAGNVKRQCALCKEARSSPITRNRDNNNYVTDKEERVLFGKTERPDWCPSFR